MPDSFKELIKDSQEKQEITQSHYRELNQEL